MCLKASRDPEHVPQTAGPIVPQNRGRVCSLLMSLKTDLDKYRNIV